MKKEKKQKTKEKRKDIDTSECRVPNIERRDKKALLMSNAKK